MKATVEITPRITVTIPLKKNQFLPRLASAKRKKTKELMLRPSYLQVECWIFSDSNHEMPPPTAKVGKDKRLFIDGRIVRGALSKEGAGQARRRKCTPLIIKEEFKKIEQLRGLPMNVGTLEEFIDEDHCIISSTMGPEYYVPIMSFVDKDQL